MSEKAKTCWDLFMGSLEMATLYIPVVFLCFFIPSESGQWTILLAAVSAILAGFAAVSSKIYWSVAKMVIAFLLSQLVLNYFVSIGFQVRGVNYWHPGYGWLTAGSYFAINMLSYLLGIIELFSVLLGSAFCFLYKKIDRPTHPLLIIKNWVCPIFCLFIFFTVDCLNKIFPPLSLIKTYYY